VIGIVGATVTVTAGLVALGFAITFGGVLTGSTCFTGTTVGIAGDSFGVAIGIVVTGVTVVTARVTVPTVDTGNNYANCNAEGISGNTDSCTGKTS
jgi:hypothetical protein